MDKILNAISAGRQTLERSQYRKTDARMRPVWKGIHTTLYLAQETRYWNVASAGRHALGMRPVQGFTHQIVGSTRR